MNFVCQAMGPACILTTQSYDKRGEEAALKLGDKVHLQEKNCRHAPDGSEYPQDDYHEGGTIDKLTKDHYLYQIKTNRGAVVEIIAETYHGYVQVD